MTQQYIGCKQVQAWPGEKDGKDGYFVKYPDGYTSWSPKDVFERAYYPMGFHALGGAENNDRVTSEMVDRFIVEVESWDSREKTTIVSAKLANGFEIVESSACVDPANYDRKVGMDCCMGRVRERVWMLLGFLVQTARFGVNGK